MNESTRRAIAYVAARLETGRPASSVYDYDAGKHFNIDGDVKDQRVNIYDYDRSCYLEGTLPSLFHFGNRAHIDFKMKSATKFEGYDYASKKHFECESKRGEVSLYDYDDGKFHSYSAS
jgi:hypothetical protein